MHELISAALDYRAGYSDILSKSVSTVTLADGVDIEAALEAYSLLSDGVKALTESDKSKLDAFAALLESVNIFKAAYQDIISANISAVTLNDADKLANSLEDYSSLSVEAKALLAEENTNLSAKKAVLGKVSSYKSAHGAILSKTLSDIRLSDASAVTAALTA